jgi:hypothetical protein
MYNFKSVTLQLTVSQTVSLGVEPHDHIYIYIYIFYSLTVKSCFCGVPSLTRGRVCLLTYMLLALAIAVFLGSKSLGTHNHIVLSQI